MTAINCTYGETVYLHYMTRNAFFIFYFYFGFPLHTHTYLADCNLLVNERSVRTFLSKAALLVFLQQHQ